MSRSPKNRQAEVTKEKGSTTRRRAAKVQEKGEKCSLPISVFSKVKKACREPENVAPFIGYGPFKVYFRRFNLKAVDDGYNCREGMCRDGPWLE